MKQRAENKDLGLYQNHVCQPCDEERALVVNALKQSSMTDAVIEEWKNPSAPLDFMKGK